MATKLKPVDVVTVGVGLTGTILAKELADTGLKVVGIERGRWRDTDPDFAMPGVHDELKYVRDKELMQDLSKETITFRNAMNETALPMRQLGSFLPGEGVGGAAVHWGGLTWRFLPWDFETKSRTLARYGKNQVAEDCTMQDWGVSYDELEPHFDRFEYLYGISGKAGNLQGKIIPGGNPFEGPRSREYPNPPLKTAHSSALFAKAAQAMGYKPFPVPTGANSRPYKNEYGATIAGCVYCGYCQFFGCEMGAKASPQTTVLPALMKSPNYELRTMCNVVKINLDSDKKRAVSVTYVDSRGREFEQPAELVLLTSYVLNNTRLMLLSGIGKPYDPETQTGVIGKNYCYQAGANITLFFENKNFNPFIATGGWGTAIDDFHTNWGFDRTKHGGIGGSYITVGGSNGRPIGYRPVPGGTPQWGSEWKRATAKWYNNAMGISASASVMPNRYNYLDLDKTYTNRFGQPLMRMTFDYKENELKLNKHAIEVISAIGKAMNPTRMGAPGARNSWSVVPYQSTHNTGGAVMGADPANSALNKYQQSWDLPNVFVTGATAFPHNSGYNPTGPVGALAFFTADAIRNKYLKNPGPLI
jgi:gluconate 2-dehydrogenase alpha chain